VLGNLEADGEVIFAIQFHCLCEVGGAELMWRDTKMICCGPCAIESLNVGYANISSAAKSSASPASEIDN
jgi:hypothetical protein